jgi:hypothetical protein
MDESTKKEGKSNGGGMEKVLDDVLDKVGFKTLVKLQPDHPGEEGEQEIDEMLAMLGLKKGKLVAVIGSKDFYKKKEE